MMQYSFDSKGLGKRLKTKRVIDDDIDLRTLAKKINVSASTLSRIENNKIPDWDSFMRICEWLNASPADFFIKKIIKSKKKL